MNCLLFKKYKFLDGLEKALIQMDVAFTHSLMVPSIKAYGAVIY